MELKKPLGRGKLGRAYGDPLGLDVSAMVERLLSEAGVEEGVGEKESINSVVESADLVMLQQSSGVY